jgi:dTMP kinase
LERLATSGLEPDLTLWLDLPLADSLRRRGHRPADRIEAAGETFLARVAAGFAALAEQRRWSRIDATAPAAAVTRACQQVLAQLGAVPGLPAGQPPGIVLPRGQASELELPGGLLGDG